MKGLPGKCVVDTNVPITANMALDPESIEDDLVDCVLACVEAIDHVVKKGRLVIDAGDEIFDEYRRKLSLSGHPGIGDHFMKWVHDNRWGFPDEDRVPVTKKGDSYYEFPHHDDLLNFDVSDRKFVAVANAHPNKPPILEAGDSKWWGWQGALAQVGITVKFLCTQYAEVKFREKMGT
jgi:hypothetical protein